MSIIDLLLSQITPYSCLGCGAESGLVCTICIAKLPTASGRCYRCYVRSADGLTCRGCMSGGLSSVQAATLYQGLAKDLLWKLKSGGVQQSVRPMAALLTPLLQPNILLTHIPTATTRVRTRGYDQARLLARELAKVSKQPHATLLARTGQAHQVGASRAERLQQLAGAFRPVSKWQIRDAHIVLIDDVLTTGATFESAARVLMDAGASQVDALAFARA